MNILIREYTKADADAVMKIWNQVVEDGGPFRRRSLSQKIMRMRFSVSRRIPVLQKTKSAERSSGCTSFIRIMSDAAAISAMPPTRCEGISAESIPYKNLCSC